MNNTTTTGNTLMDAYHDMVAKKAHAKMMADSANRSADSEKAFCNHTPGPWVARPDPNACLEDDWCVGIGDSLANIDKVAVCSKRDARLIAAAPDLLEALQKFSDYVHAEQSSTDGAVTYSTTTINHFAFLARAAIAKATGEKT
jgi:hypothetical protein